MVRNAFLWLVLFLLPLSFAAVCMNPDGLEVDWWYAYKLPGILDVLYFDSSMGNEEFRSIVAERVEKPVDWSPATETDDSVVDQNNNNNNNNNNQKKKKKEEVFWEWSFLRKTMEQLEEEVFEGHFVFYNDQPPTHPNYLPPWVIDGKEIESTFFKLGDEVAHSKGILASSERKTMWIIHSVPGFPSMPFSSKSFRDFYYALPSTASDLGQNFMCGTFKDPTAFDKITRSLSISEVYIYRSNYWSPDGAKLGSHNALWEETGMPIISYSAYKHEVYGGTFLRDGKEECFETYEMDVFLITAKFNGLSDEHKYDVWTMLGRVVREKTGSGILVGTQYRKGYLKSNKYAVNIVAMTHINTGPFTAGNDHSKFAIAAKVDEPYVCAGGNNRGKSQLHRGDVVICVKSTALRARLSSMIVAYGEPDKIVQTRRQADSWLKKKGHLQQYVGQVDSRQPPNDNNCNQDLPVFSFEEKQDKEGNVIGWSAKEGKGSKRKFGKLEKD